MTTSITVRLSLDTAAPTVTDVANAVRRAATALDKAVLVPGASVEAKGVSIRTRPLKAVTKAYSPVREWAVKNGYPEVANKRGRLSKAINEAYAAAQEVK